MKSRSLWLLLSLIVILIVGGRAYYMLTDDFRLGSIQHHFKPEERWDIPQLSKDELEHLQAILAQTYHYLGKGAQSYAFRSADDKYVLKFFKFKHLRPNAFIVLLPDWPKALANFKQTHIEHKTYRFTTLFDGHHLAYMRDRDNSALMFIHLNPTQNFLMHTTLNDKMGFHHTLDLNQFSFVLQKKGITTRALINGHLQEGNIQNALLAIKSVLDMLLNEYHRGIYDRDHGVLHNTGFVDGHPFHLDVGKLTYDESMKNRNVHLEDLHKVTKRIMPWISRHYPQYAEEIRLKIEEYLSGIFNVSFKIDE